MVGNFDKCKIIITCTKQSFHHYSGFVDVYSEDKNAVSQHAERILKVGRNNFYTTCVLFFGFNFFFHFCPL